MSIKSVKYVPKELKDYEKLKLQELKYILREKEEKKNKK